MSTESFLAFYGVRRPLDPRSAEFEAIERDEDEWSLLAKHKKLDIYCGNFHPNSGEEYYLFIGKRLGVFGGENLAHLDYSDERLLGLMEVVRRSLSEAGVAGEPALHFAWEPDY